MTFRNLLMHQKLLSLPWKFILWRIFFPPGHTIKVILHCFKSTNLSNLKWKINLFYDCILFGCLYVVISQVHYLGTNRTQAVSYSPLENFMVSTTDSACVYWTLDPFSLPNYLRCYKLFSQDWFLNQVLSDLTEKLFQRWMWKQL